MGTATVKVRRASAIVWGCVSLLLILVVADDMTSADASVWVIARDAVMIPLGLALVYALHRGTEAAFRAVRRKRRRWA